MQQLLFGTNNAHKLREIREMLGTSLQVLSLAEAGIDMDVAETEITLEGNALLKAKAYFEATGIPCFADDTGLEVAALDGAPGVYSARYAGPACDPADNIRKLLGELGGKEDRSARFRTVVAFWNGEEAQYFEGEVQGLILDELRGEGGFGYDPVFLPREHTQSFAEMLPADKHAISHRGRAMRKFVAFIQSS